MRYDDKIIYPEEPVISAEIQETINRIKTDFPEYALAGAVVTAEFIRIVSAAMDDEADHGTLDKTLSEAEIKAVIERLPMELIVNPLSTDTITAIIDKLSRVMNDEVFADSLFGECEDASDYRLRAAAKEQLGLYEDALKDYSMASVLEPDNHTYLLYRADLFFKLGQVEDAVGIALQAHEMIGDTCIDNPDNMWDTCHLVLLFDDCKNSRMTLLAMLKYVEGFNAHIPFMKFQGDGEFTVEKDGEEYSVSIIFFELFIELIKHIEGRASDDSEINMLLEQAKNGISICRARAGF